LRTSPRVYFPAIRQSYPRKVFNLSFGDWNESAGRIDDDVSSNNSDRDKVLATVAATVIEFTLDFPDAIIFAEGSTPARTRLYQMGIAKFWDIISQDFNLQGYVQGQWEDFRKSVNYESFLLERQRNSNFKTENK
jgi:hypothetical protein